MPTSPVASVTGSGASSTASTSEKITVLAPIPSANDNTAAIESAGAERSTRWP